MGVWKKCFQAVMDFIEIYMPMCWFILLFVAFILQIISRYIFNNPWYGLMSWRRFPMYGLLRWDAAMHSGQMIILFFL